MPSASASSPAPSCLHATMNATAALAKMGVTVAHRPLPPDTVADWIPHTSTLVVRVDASPRAKLWALVNLWQHVMTGASCAQPTRRHLRLLPS
jgi:hypothetical protein